MIDEDATFEAFNYYSYDLKPKSDKPILTTCDLCSAFRETTKHSYHLLCQSCAQKGRKHTEETKRFMSKNHFNRGKYGEDSSNFKGGFCTNCPQEYMRVYHKKWAKTINGKNAILKHSVERRKLGYTLLMPLVEGEVAHHVTDEYVIGVPANVHQQLSGGKRKKHRTLVLLWLKANDKKKYIKVLCVLAKQHL